MENQPTKNRLYTLSTNDIGKMQPQAIDLEEAMLGAMLLETDAYNNIADIFFPEMFYKEQNGKVAAAMIALKNRSEPIDILTVTQELKRTGDLEFVGGAYYVSSLTNRIASSANIEFHARIVLERFIKRESIRICTNMIKEAYDDTTDVFEIIDENEKSISELTSRVVVSKGNSSLVLYNKLLEQNEALINRKTDLIGVSSGYEDIDKYTGGWQKSDLLLLAARPGMGKTAFVVGVARNAVKMKKPTAIFSLEQSALQLYKRMASQETEIPHDKIRYGMDAGTQKIFERDMADLKAAPLFIDDTGALTLFELRNKARKLKREEKIELIIIDYLQLMVGGDKGGNREQEISAISRGIKALAKELDIPIIALSQLSRQVENRPGGAKIPQLSDLRDSGSLEQDADMVMFLYRPEYYGIEYDANNQSTRGLAKLIFAKNRHGAIGDIDLRWIGEIMKFIDYNSKPKIESFEQGNSLHDNEDFLEPNL